MHTTSTGDPTQTAIKPAPNPESKCVRILSEKPGIFSKVCRNGDEVKKWINCNYLQDKMLALHWNAHYALSKRQGSYLNLLKLEGDTLKYPESFYISSCALSVNPSKEITCIIWSIIWSIYPLLGNKKSRREFGEMQKSTGVFQSFSALTQSDKSTLHFKKSRDQKS